VIASEFDLWAQTYDGSALQPAYCAAHRAVLQRARGRVGHPRRVLDVGCGTGRLLGRAAEAFPGAALVGVDLSGGMLSRAGSADPVTGQVHRVQATAERLPFADTSFDLVLSTASWRHWADPGAGVREICRVLAPGGLFGLADLCGTRRPGVLATLLGRCAVPAPLAAALDAAGLDLASADMVDGYGPVPAIVVVMARRSRRPRRIPPRPATGPPRTIGGLGTAAHA
jgi:ubiquinone/menaquinone biosynthesis C-methylase UbiE